MDGKKNISNFLIYLGFTILISSPFIVGSFFITNEVVEWIVFGMGLFLALFLAGIIENKIISKRTKAISSVDSNDRESNTIENI